MEDNYLVNKGGFSDAPCSNYRSILSSSSYYMEDFDYRSILVDSGTIVQCTTEDAIEVTGRYESALKTGFEADCIESGKRNKKKTVRNLQLV